MTVKTTRKPFDFDALVNTKKRDELGGTGADAGKSNVEEATATGAGEPKSGEKSDRPKSGRPKSGMK